MRRGLNDPIEDFFEMRDRLYRLLDESFAPEQPESEPSFTPPVDILVDEERIVILVEVPGMSREDISVEVRDGVVTISGEREANGAGQYFVRERPTGGFRRSFSLAYDLDPDAVSAKLEDGVLSVTVQRREKATEIAVDEQPEA